MPARRRLAAERGDQPRTPGRGLRRRAADLLVALRWVVVLGWLAVAVAAAAAAGEPWACGRTG
ncbi:hypothetical protein [Quadrisphaera sp. DSM 44207]|uniref:hypothetical protein n=1 Tax=Quadrisphaera sp. DSM 44207 TaxID=1881057 RepID=UPI000884F6F7|nr:hypothetical protein [Quadrisphaera sp. DSM 44207]SDQ41964.1 hypothetical protein SAMN05428996_1632 [Quadrisphaera sp. DSM 44207]